MEQESHLNTSKTYEMLTAWLGFSMNLRIPSAWRQFHQLHNCKIIE